MTTLELDPRAAPLPIPAGRGRWRLVAYPRQFSTALPTPIAELTTARGRQLQRQWNQPAQLQFTLDGHSPEAALLTELAVDVVAYRWDEAYRGDRPMFRGLIDHSEDQLSEQSATVTFTCHDYFAMLTRRILTGAINSNTWTQVDQDYLVLNLLNRAITNQMTDATGATSFYPGSYLPLAWQRVNPDGSYRGTNSGELRDRAYAPGTVVGTAIDDLSQCISTVNPARTAFDYDVLASGPSTSNDVLRVFYPQQGVDRTADLTLAYGSNVVSLTRTVSSADYANYVRYIGNKASTDPNAPQLFSEQWNTDSNNVTVTPVGLWMMTQNASDVSVQATLDQKAQGDLAWYGLLTPTYTMVLRPGAYVYGKPNMGDSVPLMIYEGRLQVNTSVRIVGITYSIGDDGQEDVALTVGRPPTSLAKLLSAGARDIDALARR